MEIEEDILRLQHIYDSSCKILDITENLNYGDYIDDWVKQYAIIRCFEIIGEASRHISLKLKEEYPNVEWKKASGMRNYLIHEYFDVDYDEVWTTLKQDIPVFKSQIQEILTNLEK